jgi:hypothetical protein
MLPPALSFAPTVGDQPEKMQHPSVSWVRAERLAKTSLGTRDVALAQAGAGALDRSARLHRSESNTEARGALLASAMRKARAQLRMLG